MYFAVICKKMSIQILKYSKIVSLQLVKLYYRRFK